VIKNYLVAGNCTGDIAHIDKNSNILTFSMVEKYDVPVILFHPKHA